MRHPALIALLFVAATAIATSQPCHDLPAHLRPAVRVELMYRGGCPYALPKDSTAAELVKKLWSLRGLLVERNLVREIYPLLPSVFFDLGSSDLPDRYVVLRDRGMTESFDESTLPGGTLQKYYRVLDIIGSRLRRHPKTSVVVAGFNSAERARGETLDLSTRRAQTVQRYLTDIWGIERGRVKMIARNLPESASTRGDSVLNAENRRVEIRSSDIEIIRAITQSELRQYADPEQVRLHVYGGREGDVTRRVIEITRGGESWHSIDVITLHDSAHVEYGWGPSGEAPLFPDDDTPLSVRVALHLKDGTVCYSDSVAIPVVVITNEMRRDLQLVDKTTDRFSVFLFQFERAMPSREFGTFVREQIVPILRDSSRLSITGYASRERNAERLAHDRAKALGDIVHKLAPTRRLPTTTYVAGHDRPLYRDSLPEGRFFNRAAQIVITTPTGP